MPEYRAYLIGPDGHFVKCVELVCADDEAAKEQAKTLAEGQDVELWQEARRITEFRRTEARRSPQFVGTNARR
jgi:hypothetical protein